MSKTPSFVKVLPKVLHGDKFLVNSPTENVPPVSTDTVLYKASVNHVSALQAASLIKMSNNNSVLWPHQHHLIRLTRLHRLHHSRLRGIHAPHHHHPLPCLRQHLTTTNSNISCCLLRINFCSRHPIWLLHVILNDVYHQPPLLTMVIHAFHHSLFRALAMPLPKLLRPNRPITDHTITLHIRFSSSSYTLCIIHGNQLHHSIYSQPHITRHTISTQHISCHFYCLSRTLSFSLSFWCSTLMTSQKNRFIVDISFTWSTPMVQCKSYTAYTKHTTHTHASYFLSHT